MSSDPGWYDKDGNPIGIERANRILGDHDYRRVAQETVGPYWVSTVLLVLDHNFGVGPPLIFETMVFVQEGEDEEISNLVWRYSTLGEAQEGHRAAVAMMKDLVDIQSPPLRPEMPDTERTDG